MDAANPPPQPFTDSLRSDILLLSTYLASQQQSSSKSHPSHTELALYSSLSNLLTIGNHQCPKALNVNAVAGSMINHTTEMGTTRGLRYLICTENGRQHEKAADAYRAELKNSENSAWQANNRSRPKPTFQVSRGYKGQVYHMDTVDLDREHGRSLLDQWEPTNLKESDDSK